VFTLRAGSFSLVPGNFVNLIAKFAMKTAAGRSSHPTCTISKTIVNPEPENDGKENRKKNKNEPIQNREGQGKKRVSNRE